MSEQGFSIVILAAGKATRFKSERSKVLHSLAGHPLGEYALRAALATRPQRTYLVIGHDAEQVRKTFERPGVAFIEQKEQLGTGHALLVARRELEQCPSPTILILVGDIPLIRAETLRQLIDTHERSRAAATILTMVLADPHGYGRIVRSTGNRVRAIVEEKVATPQQRKTREVNSGTICFDRSKLLQHLGELSDDNAQKEYLLTDLIATFNRHRHKVIAFPVSDPSEVLGVNDRRELAAIEKVLRRRKAEALMHDGVTIVDPENAMIDEDVEVGPDTVIEPGVSLRGSTRTGRACRIGPYSTVENSVLGDRVRVRMCSLVSGSEVASNAVVGPFAHLRDGTVLEPNVRIGNFVEVKKSRVGRGTKALHLTYLGDASLGPEVNVGAGTVTCNYDGEKKHATTIGQGCFIGSGTMLVAPLRVGEGSYIGAGSTITEDVPAGSLALARSRQVNKEGWVNDQGKAGVPVIVTAREAGPVTVLEVNGRLTLGAAANEFREKARQVIQAGRHKIIINLLQVIYVDSAGMGELAGVLMSLKKSGGQLRLVIPEKILRLLEVANLHRVFEIHADEAEALAKFSEPAQAQTAGPET